jgi:hypothetical protein
VLSGRARATITARASAGGEVLGDPMNTAGATAGDLRSEALGLVAEAADAGVTLRVTGGVAVAIRCPSASLPPLARSYKDLDLVGPGSDRTRIDALMKSLGYSANEEFNSLHGRHQMLYVDARGRVLDVFIDRIVMCHALDVSQRLSLHESTLSPEDLLLTKLQVLHTNETDLKDCVALLSDFDLDGDRIAAILASDWGWWRTATEVLGKVKRYARDLDGLEHPDTVQARIGSLEGRIEREPKGRRWRLRARVGDRVQWYETPEEESG